MRDTVRQIIEDEAYRRATSRSLSSRFLEWLGEGIRRLIELLPPIPYGRELLIGFAVLLVLVLVVRVLMRWRAERSVLAGAAQRGARGGRFDPWLEAQRLAQQGEHLAAAQALCAAILSACARRGEVTLHHSKTTGDYAREMRRRGAPSLPTFQRFRARYDRVIYDAHACDATEYAALVESARPLLQLERAA